MIKYNVCRGTILRSSTVITDKQRSPRDPWSELFRVATKAFKQSSHKIRAKLNKEKVNKETEKG
jgi:hypothetical protein